MPVRPPLKICLATAELAPLAKTGGLADVCSALARFLHGQGHDLRILLPYYGALDTSDLAPVAVDFLQNIEARAGSRGFMWSIDAATLPGSEVPVYLLRCPELYARERIYTEDVDEHLRFGFLARASLEMCQRMGFAPDIFHCHDWHAALAPLYLRSLYAWDRLFSATRSVLTIHNIGYQGIFDAGILDDLGLASTDLLDQADLASGRVNFMKTGILHADQVTTVSPTYAREILGPQYGMGLHEALAARAGSLTGILNGVDYAEWNPETDPLIPERYSLQEMSGKSVCKRELMQELNLAPRDREPLFGIIARLTPQKGIDLLEAALPGLLRERRFSLAVLGSGERRYERFFHALADSFTGRVAFRQGYDNALAHRIEAGSDVFLMPSLYEPCGLNQMYSLRYGTVPIVRETGGLVDSVSPFDADSGRGDGIVFRDYDLAGFRWAVDRALSLYEDARTWRRMQRNGMRKDFSWARQGAEYVTLFRALAGQKPDAV